MKSKLVIARSRLVVALAAMSLVGLAVGSGCNRNGAKGAAAANEDDAPTMRSSLSAQDLYEAKRYAEAKTMGLREAESLTGPDREVALLTAGLSAHAMQQYDDAATILTPLTRSEDARIAGRAKTALDYIGIERARKSMAGTLRPAGQNTSASGSGPFTLQAGVFASATNAQKRAAQIRPQAVKAGFGEPRIVPDAINGKSAYAVQVGSFPTRQAADRARSGLSGQVVVTAAR